MWLLCASSCYEIFDTAGSLSAHLSVEKLDAMMDTLLTQLEQASSSDDLTKTYILAVAAIRRDALSCCFASVLP